MVWKNKFHERINELWKRAKEQKSKMTQTEYARRLSPHLFRWGLVDFLLLMSYDGIKIRFLVRMGVILGIGDISTIFLLFDGYFYYISTFSGFAFLGGLALAAFIEIENLEHEYRTADGKGHKALAGISLSIGKGEFVAVLGANGSGKSTLARHLNGLLLPSAGQVRIDGLSTLEAAEKNELWKIRSQVGMVFQNPDNQLIAAIVEDDVAFGPENLGVEPVEIRQRVTEALQAVGMERFRKRAPHLLSGGQKQRVAIAGTLAMETDCLVLDEPTAMLDPQGRKEVMGVVERLHREKGLTVVLITHFMAEAMQAQRVVVMGEGKVLMEGSPGEIFAQGEKLKSLGLEVPLAGELAERLRKAGLPLSPGPMLTAEELLAGLKEIRGKGYGH